MGKKREFLNNSVIIAAHAGDEVLWFSSIVQHVDQVITVYRDFWADPTIGAPPRGGAGRVSPPRHVLPEHRRGRRLWLRRLERPGSDRRTASSSASRPTSAPSPASRASRSPQVPVLNRAAAAAKSVGRGYKDNFQAIYDALKGKLTADMNVFTHNPWGEYGHEENIQVFRVLQILREEIGFRLWMSNYCTDRAAPLAMRYFVKCPGGYVRQETDKVFAARVADIYKKHGCWTWADDWAWFDDECFMEAPRADSEVAAHHHLFPLNFFTIDGSRSRNWLPVALTVSVATAAFGVALAE